MYLDLQPIVPEMEPKEAIAAPLSGHLAQLPTLPAGKGKVTLLPILLPVLFPGGDGSFIPSWLLITLTKEQQQRIAL